VTTATTNLLHLFDSLSESEQHDALVELLRREPGDGDIPDDVLTAAADELFAQLDAEEEGNAQP